MKRGQLSDYFRGVGVKKLAAVDADAETSNQHEITGSKPLLQILGDQDRNISQGGEDRRFVARYIWLDAEQEAISEAGYLSWYNSRRNQAKRTAEWRLYYQSNAVTEMMQPGDTLFVARTQDDRLFFIVTPDGSTIQNQLLWLFGLDIQPDLVFAQREIGKDNDAELDFAVRCILEELGIEPEEPEADRLDALIDQFGLVFPSTRVFSKMARTSLPDVSALDDPDLALVEWMSREEQLFRRLERRVVAERISAGFRSDDGADVDGFLGFSLSVQNRRKSRAGFALENHLEAIFSANGIRYVRGAETENRNKPDFLFPGQIEYRDSTFPADRLTMLGSKSTLKDRWRQVLSEATRIQDKHLLTLEPGISENQTDEMQAKHLRLVLPKKIHASYKPKQQAWLMNASQFITLVAARQK